jgi:Acetyltransferase (GNAT) domain
MTMFHEPWWLDTVAPGTWAAAEFVEGGKTVATMPYALSRKYGLCFISMPPLTQVLGPLEPDYGGKYAKTLARQKDVYEGLIAALPRFDLFRQSFHSGVTNWLPFHWRGFAQTTRYTYRLDLQQPLDALWSGTQEKTRTDIRKAQRMLTLREEDDPDRFAAILHKTFERQGMASPLDAALIRRLFEIAPRQVRFKAVSAVDAAGAVHGVALFLGDERCVYYLLGGADPALRSSGCQGLLVWAGIEWAAGFSRVFDFEGSMIEGVERFVRGFGARQQAYFQLTAMSRRMSVLWHGAAALRALAGKPTSVFLT